MSSLLTWLPWLPLLDWTGAVGFGGGNVRIALGPVDAAAGIAAIRPAVGSEAAQDASDGVGDAARFRRADVQWWG